MVNQQVTYSCLMPITDARCRHIKADVMCHFDDNLLTPPQSKIYGITAYVDGILGFKLRFILEKNGASGAHITEWIKHFAKALSMKYNIDVNTF